MCEPVRSRFDRLTVSVAKHYSMTAVFKKDFGRVFFEKTVVVSADGAYCFIKEFPSQMLNIVRNVAEMQNGITIFFLYDSIGAVLRCESEKTRYFKGHSLLST